MRPLSRREELVACFGGAMNTRCSAAMSEFARISGELCVGFVMADWLTPAQQSEISLVWIVDSAARFDVADPTWRGIPLLVPAEREDLVNFCVENECGLYYASEQEALQCLEIFFRDVTVRRALRKNAFALSRAFAASTRD